MNSAWEVRICAGTGAQSSIVVRFTWTCMYKEEERRTHSHEHLLICCDTLVGFEPCTGAGRAWHTKEWMDLFRLARLASTRVGHTEERAVDMVDVDTGRLLDLLLLCLSFHFAICADEHNFCSGIVLDDVFGESIRGASAWTAGHSLFRQGLLHALRNFLIKEAIGVTLQFRLVTEVVIPLQVGQTID